MRGQNLRADSGFTLVETLVAFAILALTLSVAIEIVRAGAQHTAITQGTSVALALAEEQLALAATGRMPIRKGSADGFAWSITTEPLGGSQTAGFAVAPHKVRMETRAPGKDEPGVVLETILLLPVTTGEP